MDGGRECGDRARSELAFALQGIAGAARLEIGVRKRSCSRPRDRSCRETVGRLVKNNLCARNLGFAENIEFNSIRYRTSAYSRGRMSDIKALLRSIPRRDWLSTGSPRYLQVCRSDMKIEIHATSGGSGIKTCKTVVVSIQSTNSIPQSFICPRSEVLQ